ncbi:hypothetical protein Vretimale_2617 [Volvox reticuliferus]|uniref:Uncharacterized protein n=1 Tax=Volvox reticuliferus TaxID=1737510 RepID=A0A8J4D758_9CHLO|nr:hypothetical protein Vretifemale_1896 [Volvox reticuliferus]GIL96874.1 hypothetical protein Vretimale_2617 [Volvox reticuliferus]
MYDIQPKVCPRSPGLGRVQEGIKPPVSSMGGKASNGAGCKMQLLAQAHLVRAGLSSAELESIVLIWSVGRFMAKRFQGQLEPILSYHHEATSIRILSSNATPYVSKAHPTPHKTTHVKVEKDCRRMRCTKML